MHKQPAHQRHGSLQSALHLLHAGRRRFQDRSELLTFEEIARFVEMVVPLGIDKIRLTGGEPLLRSELPKLVAMLAASRASRTWP